MYLSRRLPSFHGIGSKPRHIRHAEQASFAVRNTKPWIKRHIPLGVDRLAGVSTALSPFSLFHLLSGSGTCARFEIRYARQEDSKSNSYSPANPCSASSKPITNPQKSDKFPLKAGQTPVKTNPQKVIKSIETGQVFLETDQVTPSVPLETGQIPLSKPAQLWSNNVAKIPLKPVKPFLQKPIESHSNSRSQSNP